MVPSLVPLRLSQRCPILLTEMPCQRLFLASNVGRELQRKRMTGLQRLSQRVPHICNAVRKLHTRRRMPSQAACKVVQQECSVRYAGLVAHAVDHKLGIDGDG